MSGIEDHNFPLFHKVAKQLRKQGNRVYNPAEFPNNWTAKADVRKAFASYCAFICLEADTIVLLPGHEDSAGCRIELGLARKCKLEALEYIENSDESLYPFALVPWGE